MMINKDCEVCARVEKLAKDPEACRAAGQVCTGLGFASIFGSILAWFSTTSDEYQGRASAERFGIFVGLWAPTFFILGNLLDRYADRLEDQADDEAEVADAPKPKK